MNWKLTDLTLRYDGQSVVTVSKDTAADLFDHWLKRAHEVLNHFPANKPGSRWGCDGIGYSIQKRLGQVTVHQSGVGPKRFKECLEQLAKKQPVEVSRG